jgi:hypothetical protein
MDEQIKPPDAGKTSIRMGKAFLRPAKDKGHYELMRPIVTVINEGDKVTTEAHGDPVGPLAIYRVKSKGDKTPTYSDMVQGGPPMEMRTSDPITKQPLTLLLVWWPGKE